MRAPEGTCTARAIGVRRRAFRACAERESGVDSVEARQGRNVFVSFACVSVNGATSHIN